MNGKKRANEHDEAPASDGDPWRPASGAHDPHAERRGETACDAGDCAGEGEEGFRAEDYPGKNPLRNESEAARVARERAADAAPRGARGSDAPAVAPREDARIRDEVLERVARIEPAPAAIVVRVADGVVALDGRVRDRDARRTLESAIRTIAGVRAVESRLAIG